MTERTDAQTIGRAIIIAGIIIAMAILFVFIQSNRNDEAARREARCDELRDRGDLVANENVYDAMNARDEAEDLGCDWIAP